MTVKERLIKFAKTKERSIRAFEKTVGLTIGYVNAIRVSIQPDKIKRIASYYPDLNIEWLLYGKGDMLKINTESEIGPNQQIDNMELYKLLEAIERHGEEVRKQGERLDRMLDLIAPIKQSKVG